MNWTLNDETLEARGAEGNVLTRVSLDLDTLTFTAAGLAGDAEPVFAYGAAVVLKYGETVRFRGRCDTPARYEKGADAGHSYTIAGPWWYLDHTPLQQLWKMQGGAADKLKGRCIQGLDADGDPVPVATAVTAVLQYAIDCGAPIAIGTITLPLIVAPFECRDVMCSEALRMLLRRVPDAVGWWNYTVNPPALNIRRRSDLTAVEQVMFGENGLEDWNIKARPDLQPSCVVLKYEITNTVDGVEQTDLVIDAAPEGSLGDEIGALVQTINLKGADITSAQRTYAEHKVRTAPIYADTDGYTSQLNAHRRFWAERVPELAAADKVSGSEIIPELTFKKLTGEELYFRRFLARPAGEDGSGPYELEDPADLGSDKIRLDEDLPRILLEGEVTEWMGGIKAQAQTIQANIQWKKNGVTIGPRQVDIQVMATDAQTATYSSLESESEGSVEPGEVPPTGVAAAQFAALSVLQFEGMTLKMEEECSGFAGPGNVLNLTGGRAEWTTMNATIQSVTENIDAGTTAIAIGPAKHLGVGDMIEQQRIERRPEGNTGMRGANAASRRTGTR